MPFRPNDDGTLMQVRADRHPRQMTSRRGTGEDAPPPAQVVVDHQEPVQDAAPQPAPQRAQLSRADAMALGSAAIGDRAARYAMAVVKGRGLAGMGAGPAYLQLRDPYLSMVGNYPGARYRTAAEAIDAAWADSGDWTQSDYYEADLARVSGTASPALSKGNTLGWVALVLTLSAVGLGAAWAFWSRPTPRQANGRRRNRYFVQRRSAA